jgi:hypothetical protein
MNAQVSVLSNETKLGEKGSRYVANLAKDINRNKRL